MRWLLLLLLSPAVGCVAIDLEVDEVCAESSLTFAPSTDREGGSAGDVVAEVKVDLGLFHGSGVAHNLKYPESLLEFGVGELDDVTSVAATVAADGEAPGPSVKHPVSAEERVSHRLSLASEVMETELLDKLARGRVTIRYVVTGRPPPALAATARTCVSSSTRIEKSLK